MIKILFHLNQLGYGGTEKSILTFINHLNRTIFQPSVFFNTDINTFRHQKISLLKKFSENYRKKFQEKYVFSWARKNEFSSAVEGRLYLGWGMSDFLQCLTQVQPAIIHFNRGLPHDFYTERVSELPNNLKIIDHNIFATKPSLSYQQRIEKMVFISHWCLDKSPWANHEKSEVLYNPVAVTSDSVAIPSLRKKLGIPSDAIVLGRLSRPNLDDGEIILECLLRIFRKYPNTYFLNIGASDNFKKSARNLTKVYFLPPTSDENLIDEFLKSLDIFLHYRREGETFGLNIAEAMYRGIPVVSHRSDIDNAQVELLTKHGVSGILASSATLEHYFLAIETLIADRGLRHTLGKNGQTSALSCFNAQRLTDKLESIYVNALSK